MDIVLETASRNGTIREASEIVRHFGQIVLNGYYPPSESRIDWHWLRRKELTLYCADSRNDARLKGTLDLIASGAMNVRDLVTHVFSPREASDAYGLVLGRDENYLGIVFDWKRL